MNQKIQKFSDLVTWQKAHRLALDIYRVTRSFPSEERYGLIDQIRRAAVSISSNIAEGFGRQTKNDQKHFYTIAHGSLMEVQNQLILAKDLEFLSTQQFDEILQLSDDVARLLHGLISSLN